MRGYTFTDLSIVTWNIHGVFQQHAGFRYNKLHSPHFVDAINGARIFALLETHHTSTEIDQIQFSGYKCFNVCRKKRQFGRNSGGIAVYVENSILDGVKKIPSSGSENILLKLKQSFFGLDRDIAICFSYCVPENSSFQVREQLDVFGDIELKLSSLGQDIDKLCFGDFNSRTGLKLDYLQSEDNTDIPVPLDIYETDAVSALPRLNMDSKTNKYGEYLLSLCKSVPLRICNGRKLGDILGSYTCYTANGQSCVDYCLASPRIYDKVETFSVGLPLLTMSDHCPIRAILKVKIASSLNNVEDYNFVECPTKITWNKDIAFRFENILQSPEYSNLFDQFVSTDIGNFQSEIDIATVELTNMLVTAAQQSDNCPKLDMKRKIKKTAGCRRKAKKRVAHPQWHDVSCYEAHRKVVTTAKLLKSYPKNSYLLGKLRTETKEYNKLVKSKHKQFVDNMFTELDTMQHNNPRGYMQLIKSMRDGNFDKQTPDDTSGVSASEWHSHFSDLLTKSTDPTKKHWLNDFLLKNVERLKTKLDEKISVEEFDFALKNLKNNKASSFDRITNEILKTSGKIYKSAFMHLFNSIRQSGLYPSPWKKDILHPIHKSDEKDDPNNFRGISISSCFGKFFIKILKNRLENFINEKGLLSKNQGSGKKNSRTSDHLMIIKFLIDKIVKGEGKKLYACFVDVKKAYDCTSRELMLYKLFTEYGIGGNFNKTLQAMYDNHEVFVRVSGGLLQPILTKIGLKQGCGISPLLFNLFIDKITTIFDRTCDPVSVGGEDLSCLLWADDLILLSSSPEGLQNAINKTHEFYNDVGLEMNTKKTKVLVFNSRGLKLTNNNFYVGGCPLEIADSYQYLGIKLKPSGTFQFAVGDLFDKANKAWFAISNVLYQHKKLAVKKALQLFDSLIRPIFLYAAELWFPFIVTKKSFDNISCLMRFWEKFQPELLNQKVCRLLLSVHKKCSRLAVLGELGRYPVMLPAIKLCLKYQYQIEHSDKTSFIYKVVQDMKGYSELDCWYNRMDKIKKLFNIRRLYGKPEKVGKSIDKILRSKFDRFFLDEINQSKIGSDGCDHNKLRLYKTFKGSFATEPYITNICNRNQRAWLSRFRTSAHRLRIETGRHTSPVTPLSQRICKYCDSGQCDTEQHAILECSLFNLKRQCFFARVTALNPTFLNLTTEQQLKTILCPATTKLAKCVSKFLGIISDTRNEIDLGLPISHVQQYILHKSQLNS